MEYFFVDDKFYREVEDYLMEVDMEKEDVEELPDDYHVAVLAGKKEKIFVLKEDVVVGAILKMADKWEERFPEESDGTFDQIKKAIKASVDMAKLNSLLPELYYPTGEDGKLTKQDLLDAC